ncbi:class I SAM-dependent methyltransferase [Marinactinospora rubrisoli]|uniref:Class I SAM-dependent methyltransferase n=1 Tax=Marinactinospora rubrisoli TaxID=2715399 RepID=A0ABW2KAD9_9ACTN
MRDLTEDYIVGLYLEYADALRAVRARQRELHRNSRDLRARLDDIEAEVTYLLLRAGRPRCVVEAGCLHGWSTTWILQALRDNGHGRLVSIGPADGAVRRVPPELAATGWEFRHGDIRRLADRCPADLDHLFIDAAHTASFARWYLDSLLPRMPAPALVSVHDVFHRRRPLPFSEGAEVLKWLSRTGTRYFTAAPARAPRTFDRLTALRRRLDLGEPIRASAANPMVYFRLG